MNITEDDLMKIFKVSDVMDTDVPNIPSSMPLTQLIEIVSNTDSFYYSVIDEKENLVGAITMDGIRKTFMTQELNSWLIAMDIIEPVILKTPSDKILAKGISQMKKKNIDYAPVVESEDSDKIVGVLDIRSVKHKLSTEVLKRQQIADGAA